MARRPHPYITIPPGAAPPSNPSPSARDPPLSPVNLWADRRYHAYTPSSASNSTYSTSRISLDVSTQPTSRPASVYEAETSRLSFPEPQLYRSSSQRSSRSSYRPSSSVMGMSHRSTRSDSVLSPESLVTPTQMARGESRPPLFCGHARGTPHFPNTSKRLPTCGD